MKIVICDDEPRYLSDITSHVGEYMKNRFIECSITSTTDPSSVLQDTNRYDLAFLDIQMEPIDGIALAKELRKRNAKLILFFITNYEEYQDDAMDLQAMRYFSKPFDVDRLYSGLNKAMEYIDGAYVDIFLYGDNAQQRVLVDQILYLTRINRKTVMYTTLQDFTLRESLDEWIDRLPALFFYQVHNSFFVNLHYVQKYSYSELILTDGARIPIAPRKQSAFHKYWFEYLRRQ